MSTAAQRQVSSAALAAPMHASSSAAHIDGDAKEDGGVDHEREQALLEQLAQDEQDCNPEERASLFSTVFFTYATPLIRLGTMRPLVQEDVWTQAKEDQCQGNAAAVLEDWKERHGEYLDQFPLLPPSEKDSDDGSASESSGATTKANGSTKSSDDAEEGDNEETQQPNKKGDSQEAAADARPFRHTLFRSVWNRNALPVAMAVMFVVIERSCTIIIPLLIEQFILWLEDTTAPESEGFEIAGWLFLATLGSSVLHTRGYHITVRLLIRATGALATLIHGKALTVQTSELATKTTGEVVNLMSTDATRVATMFFEMANGIVVPVQVSVILYLLYETIGSATFAGLGVMLLLFPAMGVIMGLLVHYNTKVMGFADQRVKLTNEILQSIRVVKFYAWEHSFADRIFGIRDDELVLIRKLQFAHSFITFFFLLLPVFTSLASFGVYTSSGNVLTAPTAFRALAFFGALQFPLVQLPVFLSTAAAGLVSSRRIQEYLEKKDLDPEAIAVVDDKNHDDDVPKIEIKNASFRWSPATPAILKDVNMRIQRGKLTAVIGPVAAGKSSLVHAMLGELVMDEGGSITRSDRDPVSYVAQTAWIQNGTVRNGVLFGKEFDQARYDAVVDACALKADLDIMPLGDQTLIGERGINLSGGQKQRIALARACYHENDWVILDDPLSAVDAHVGRHIFDKCVRGWLEGRTVVMVTNQLHFLPRCDYIYVLGPDGMITDAGTYDELHDKGADFHALMKSHVDDLNKHVGNSSSNVSENDDEDDDDNEAKRANVDVDVDVDLMMMEEDGDEESKHRDVSVSRSGLRKRRHRSMSREEERKSHTVVDEPSKQAGNKVGVNVSEEEEIQIGDVSWTAYVDHARAMGGPWFVFVVLFILLIGQLLITSTSFVLAAWSEKSASESDGYYIRLYALIAVLATAALLVRGLLMAIGSANASGAHHSALFNSVVRAKMAFFDVTPVGRILNRFSKDLNEIDTQLAQRLKSTLAVCGVLLGSLIGAVVVVPIFSVAIVFVLAIFYRLQLFYKPAALQLKRLASVNRSPIFQQFSETLQGVVTIRAFGHAQMSNELNQERINTHNQTMFCERLVFRWASLRIGVLNAIMASSASLLIVLSRDDIDPGLAGVALTSVVSVSGFLGFLVFMLAEVANAMNAIERFHHYIHNVEHEDEWKTPDDPDEEWPSRGEIVLDNVEMVYRHGLEPALKGISCVIKPGEKIGVAGRTGSGKSSLLLSMMRMYPLQRGSIKLDGVDISGIGLHALRGKIAIIPQEPVIWSGSLRQNLDPFDEFTDGRLWKVLEDVHMIDWVRRSPEQLMTVCAEYGSNLSLGQRQLLCLGRAILRQPKVLLLDEATSSMDSRTDALVQTTVREQFGQATVITIAHRLNTIMDSDRILVLEQGNIAEFDSPKELLANPQSHFYGLYQAMVAGHAKKNDGDDDGDAVVEENDTTAAP